MAENYDTPGTGAFAPEVLDPMVSRHADWAGAEFTDESWSHVSVYRLPGA